MSQCDIYSYFDGLVCSSCSFLCDKALERNSQDECESSCTAYYHDKVMTKIMKSTKHESTLADTSYKIWLPILCLGIVTVLIVGTFLLRRRRRARAIPLPVTIEATEENPTETACLSHQDDSGIAIDEQEMAFDEQEMAFNEPIDGRYLRVVTNNTEDRIANSRNFQPTCPLESK